MSLQATIVITFTQIHACSIRFEKITVVIWWKLLDVISYYIGKDLGCRLSWILEITTMRKFMGKTSETSPKYSNVTLVLQWLQTEWKRPEFSGLGFISEANSKGVSLSQFGGKVNSLKQEHQLSMRKVSATKIFQLLPLCLLRVDKVPVFHISWQLSAFPSQDNPLSQPRFSL